MTNWLTKAREIQWKATVGPWPNYNNVRSQIEIDGVLRPAIAPSDADFIAFYNPETVGKMLDVIEASQNVSEDFWDKKAWGSIRIGPLMRALGRLGDE